MSPRKRNNKNKNLPPNLYTKRVGETVYYRYRHPLTRKEHGMGTDALKAISAAKVLNARLLQSQSVVDTVLTSNSKSIAETAKGFRADMVDNHPKLAESSKANKGYKLDRIIKDIGQKSVHGFRTIEASEFLSQFKRDPYKQYRLVLEQLFNYAISKGYYEGANPVTPTPATDMHDPGKERGRLTLPQYKAIYASAPDWFQIAMDLALHLAQGRSEVANMKFSDIRDGYIYIIRQKTQKKEHSRLRIKLSPYLEQVISRARALPPLDQNIVHYLQRRGTHSVTPDNLSKTFKRLRDDTGLFKGPPRSRPSFHEMRALSAHLMEKQGVEKGDIQAIMAHAEASTTDIYLGGHVEKWVDAQAPVISLVG